MTASRRSVVIEKPGLFTTVQDLGRPGFGRLGVSPSGAMDPLAFRTANRLAGNPDGAAALEVTAIGPVVLFAEETRFALAGADLGGRLDDAPVAAWRAHTAPAGARLAFGTRVRGARCTVALAGGIAPGGLDVFLGSVATDIDGGFGGVDARPLRAGQVLALGPAPAPAAARPVDIEALLPQYEPPFELRFIPDEAAALTAGAREAFAASPYRVTERSNRVGYRLSGAALAGEAAGGRLSEAIPPGTLQVPPDGQPILLMADRQSVGGYPRLGYVIRADLPRAAQLWLGDSVRFRESTIAEAQALAVAQERALEGAS